MIIREKDGTTLLDVIGLFLGLMFCGLGMILCGCSSLREGPITRSVFLNTDWVEVRADPGVVNQVCEQNSFEFGKEYCGCAVFQTKEVWIARRYECDINNTRIHELCHVLSGSSKDAVAQCHNSNK